MIKQHLIKKHLGKKTKNVFDQQKPLIKHHLIKTTRKHECLSHKNHLIKQRSNQKKQKIFFDQQTI